MEQRKSHHISNFSSAEVVTVVASKISVVSDEHQNCVGGGGKILSLEARNNKRRGLMERETECHHFHVQNPKDVRFMLLIIHDIRYGKKNGVVKSLVI